MSLKFHTVNYFFLSHSILAGGEKKGFLRERNELQSPHFSVIDVIMTATGRESIRTNRI